MDMLMSLFDFVLHMDAHLAEAVRLHGMWIYLILFAIVFAETGLVVTPFLPGDSLLFVAGALAAGGSGLNVHLLAFTLVLAAFLGNTCNYAIGKFAAPRFFRNSKSRWLNPAHLERTHAFYEKYGGSAVIISRFVPIVRTYVPFVAGLGTMHFPKFSLYNLIGALAWVLSITYLGYFFGNVPWIRENQGFIIVAILVISVIPVVVEFIKARRKSRAAGKHKR